MDIMMSVTNIFKVWDHSEIIIGETDDSWVIPRFSQFSNCVGPRLAIHEGGTQIYFANFGGDTLPKTLVDLIQFVQHVNP